MYNKPKIDARDMPAFCALLREARVVDSVQSVAVYMRAEWMVWRGEHSWASVLSVMEQRRFVWVPQRSAFVKIGYVI